MSTKQSFLQLLARSPGATLSGEEAARALGVSRNAIWKAAKALRQEGLQLEAASGGGYRLTGSKDLYTAEALALYTNGAPVRLLERVDSTNNAARQWAMEGAPEGALICAKSQSGGKGRLGRSFASPEGGLYMSMVLRPVARLQSAVLLTSAAAVAVCRAVEKLCGISLSIKWVNDLYLGEKKVCGILTEGVAGLENGSIEFLVCGIGLNYAVNQNAYPKELWPILTSLYPGGGAPVSPARLAGEIHHSLLGFAGALEKRAFLPEYRARSFLIGREVRVLAKEPYPALVTGIDDEARLLVKTRSGEEKALSSGEVSVLPGP